MNHVQMMNHVLKLPPDDFKKVAILLSHSSNIAKNILLSYNDMYLVPTPVLSELKPR
jgi:hypothetical protein